MLRAVLFLLLVGVVYTGDVYADQENCDPAWRRAGMCPDQQNPSTEINNDNRSGSKASSRSQSKSAAEAAASATGGKGYGGDSSGQQVSSTFDSTYIAVQRNLPRAIGCFGPVDGGGGEGSNFAFIGITLLNKDCFAQEVSAGYNDHMIKSRVECGSKWFRNAISFQIRRRDRQSHCVDWMMGRYEASVAHIRNEIAKVEAQREYEEAIANTKDRMQQCHEDVKSLTARHVVSVESTRRATEAWKECLGK